MLGRCKNEEPYFTQFWRFYLRISRLSNMRACIT